MQRSRGRPLKGTAKLQGLPIRLTQDVIDAAEEAARARGLTRTEFVRSVIEAAVVNGPGPRGGRRPDAPELRLVEAPAQEAADQAPAPQAESKEGM